MAGRGLLLRRFFRRLLAARISGPYWGSRCEAVLITLGMFAASALLINTTKWIFRLQFPYPFFVTMANCAFVWLVVFLVTHPWPTTLLKTHHHRPLVERSHRLSWGEQVSTVVPFAALGAFSIGAGNMSLVLLYPSFHEMIQNTTPFWTLLVMVFLGGKSYNWYSYLAMIPICCGGSLCCLGEVNFSLLGILFSFASSLLRAVRVLVQARALCEFEKGPITSITLLFYAAPWSLLVYLVVGFLVEGLAPWRDLLLSSPDPARVDPALGTDPSRRHQILHGLLLTGCVAVFFHLFSYLVVARLGALASMIVGNLKNFTVIVSSLFVFHNAITASQIIGFAVICAGAALNDRWGGEVKNATTSGEATALLEEVKDVSPDIYSGGESDSTHAAEENASQASTDTSVGGGER